MLGQHKELQELEEGIVKHKVQHEEARHDVGLFVVLRPSSQAAVVSATGDQA